MIIILKRVIVTILVSRIAVGGADEFYKGETAKKLVADVRAAGGIITMQVQLVVFPPNYILPFLLLHFVGLGQLQS